MFLGFQFLGPASEDGGGYDIRVDRPALLAFVQARAQGMDDGAAPPRIATLPEEGLVTLVKDYVRQEALYREAVALGLDQNDPAIRRRMIQSLEFVALSASTPQDSLEVEEVKRFYREHLERYSIPPNVSFTHIFFSANGRGRDQARRLASRAQARLKRAAADGVAVGDRFLYQRNYVDEDADAIRSQFGAEIAAALFRLPADPSTWQGPFESAHGAHLLKVVRRDDGGPAPFEAVRPLVERDAADAARKGRQKALMDKLVARYRVQVADDLPPP